MRVALMLCLLAAPSFAAADPRAPEPGQLPAQTPAQNAAQDMIQVYEEFCLVHFPDVKAVAAGANSHHLAAATPEEAAKTLLGRPGQAWQLPAAAGGYTVAIESPPRQGCAVSGDVADDAGIRAAFDLLVGMFANAHEFGALDRQPLRRATMHGQSVAVQLIGATPDGRPRQAFVNMATGDGEVLHVRMTRELAPN